MSVTVNLRHAIAGLLGGGSLYGLYCLGYAVSYNDGHTPPDAPKGISGLFYAKFKDYRSETFGTRTIGAIMDDWRDGRSDTKKGDE